MEMVTQVSGLATSTSSSRSDGRSPHLRSPHLDSPALLCRSATQYVAVSQPGEVTWSTPTHLAQVYASLWSLQREVSSVCERVHGLEERPGVGRPESRESLLSSVTRSVGVCLSVTNLSLQTRGGASPLALGPPSPLAPRLLQRPGRLAASSLLAPQGRHPASGTSPFPLPFQRPVELAAGLLLS